MKNQLPADVATADVHDALVANDGCIWVRDAHDTWQYVNEEDDGTVSFGYDTRRDLPAEYEPYAPIDRAATKLIMRALRVVK